MRSARRVIQVCLVGERGIYYPCLCLWRGFWQITRTAPFRRITLHFSHIGFTEARTFIAPVVVSTTGLPPAP
jgi:hypothetical protein